MSELFPDARRNSSRENKMEVKHHYSYNFSIKGNTRVQRSSPPSSIQRVERVWDAQDKMGVDKVGRAGRSLRNAV